VRGEAGSGNARGKHRRSCATVANDAPGLSAPASSRPSGTCTVAATTFAFIPIAVADTAFIIAAVAKSVTIVAVVSTDNAAIVVGATRQRRHQRSGCCTPRRPRDAWTDAGAVAVFTVRAK